MQCNDMLKQLRSRHINFIITQFKQSHKTAHHIHKETQFIDYLVFNRALSVLSTKSITYEMEAVPIGSMVTRSV